MTTNVVERLLADLNVAIATGRARIVMADGSDPTGRLAPRNRRAPVVGWLDGDDLYLDPKKLLKLAEWDLDSLRAALWEAGRLQVPDPVRRRLAGRRRVALLAPAGLVFP